MAAKRKSPKKESLFVKRMNEAASQLTESDELIAKLREFHAFLGELVPSKNTHYDRLSEWSDKVDSFIDPWFQHVGHKRGQQVNSDDPSINFVWALIKQLDCFNYSEHYYDLKDASFSAHHHCSAFVRNYCLKEEVGDFLAQYKSSVAAE